MDIESFINWVFRNNTFIIEVLIGVVLLLGLFLAYRSFKHSVAEGSNDGKGIPPNLEEMLEKILEKATAVQASSKGGLAAGDGSEMGAEQGQLLSEITALKNELQEKQKQIEDLKASGDAAGAAGNSDDLQAKIKELEGKLAEYEIISEDIADLSFYKEQNAKLERELQEMKAKASVAAPVAAAPNKSEVPTKVEPPPVESKPAPAIEKTAAEPAKQPEPEVKPAEDNTVNDDLMAEFAAAVEQQKTAEKPAENTQANAAVAPAASEVKPEAELSAPPQEMADANVKALGEMDMDKMLAEAAEIKVDETVKITPEEAIGEAVDESKLMQEAAALGTVSEEDARLMGEFENFVKKNEG